MALRNLPRLQQAFKSMQEAQGRVEEDGGTDLHHLARGSCSLATASATTGLKLQSKLQADPPFLFKVVVSPDFSQHPATQPQLLPGCLAMEALHERRWQLFCNF